MQTQWKYCAFVAAVDKKTLNPGRSAFCALFKSKWVMNRIRSLECLWSERQNGTECTESEMKSLLAPQNLHLEIKRAFRELLYLLRRGWSYITEPDPHTNPHPPHLQWSAQEKCDLSTVVKSPQGPHLFGLSLSSLLSLFKFTSHTGSWEH